MLVYANWPGPALGYTNKNVLTNAAAGGIIYIELKERWSSIWLRAILIRRTHSASMQETSSASPLSFARHVEKLVSLLVLPARLMQAKS